MDGGAVENRGLISLLYYLHTLPPETLAKVHVAVVDVSGLSTGFSQTRGTAAALGAPRKLGTLLIAQLVESLRAKPGGDQVRFYDFTLPRALRSSFGTHWRMQKTVTVRRAAPPVPTLAGAEGERLQREAEEAFEAETKRSVELTQAEVERLFEDLFLGPPALEGSASTATGGERLQTVWRWLREEYEAASAAPAPRPWDELDRLVEALRP